MQNNDTDPFESAPTRAEIGAALDVLLRAASPAFLYAWSMAYLLSLTFGYSPGSPFFFCTAGLITIVCVFLRTSGKPNSNTPQSDSTAG